MKRFLLLKNAFILVLTSLILRTIGIFFRVYLSNKIGAEGMGLYQLVFSIYILASTFAVSGISTAVTRLVSEQVGKETRRSIRRIMRRAVMLSFTFGIFSSLIVFLFAKPIALYGLGDMRAVPALRILSVGLPFMGLSSCFRGYFIARRRVSNSTGAQLFEQFVRITTIVLIIGSFSDKGISASCAAVMIADTLAETLACGYLAIGYMIDKRRLPTVAGSSQKQGFILRKMLRISLPVSAGRYLNTALHTVENLLVPNCLARFSGSRERALSQFGMLKGMAMPILFFPASFLSAISTLLVPEISEAAVMRQSDKVIRAVNQSMRITLLLSIPVSALFIMFSKQLGMLIYHDEQVGFLIGALAPITPFMYLESVVDGILKGLDQQVSSLKYNMFNSVVRIVTIVLLVPLRGIRGFLLIMIVSNILTSSLNVRRLLRVAGVRMRWGQWVFKPMLAIATSVVTTKGICRFFENNSLPMIMVILGVSSVILILYGILLALFGCVGINDFEWFNMRRKVKPLGNTKKGLHKI